MECLVRGICGSLIRSNAFGKLGPRTRRTRCRMARASALFLASCLSRQFDFPGKRYAVSEDLRAESRISLSGPVKLMLRQPNRFARDPPTVGKRWVAL